MYIIDDICYAGKFQENIKIIEAVPLQGRMMLVTFSTGEKRLFDTTKLQGSVFDILDDEEIFNNPSLFHGIITWNKGAVDIAPEMVYRESLPYSSKDTHL